jgi:hypothetical protein
MDPLHDLLTAKLSNILRPERLAALMIAKKLAELGITISDEQLHSLEIELDRDLPDTLSLDLDDEQEVRIEAYRDPHTGKLAIQITNQDIESLLETVNTAYAESVPKVLEDSSADLLRAWKSQAGELLESQRSERDEIAETIVAKWREAIDHLEMLHSICLQAGAEFNDTFQAEAAAANDHAFDALRRLHARSCQIGSEILTLLRGGFADGADARWRTLHEIAVTGLFINKHGSDVAERYLAHSAVRDYQDARAYQRHCKTLGFEPLTEPELKRLKASRDKACSRYGKHFHQDQGWAASVINNPRGNVTFADIERDVRLAHLRWFYKLACINVHAGAQGGFFSLGLPPNVNNLLIAGPSLFGLRQPGQNTALSLNQITFAFLSTRSSLSRIAFLKALQELALEVFYLFASVSDEMQNDASAADGLVTE